MDEMTFRVMLREELQPLRDLLLKHETTLYGPNGKNGLYGTVGELQDDVTSLKTHSRIASVLGGLATSIGLVTLGVWLKTTMGVD